MKKNLYKLPLLLMMFSLIIGCEEDLIVYDNENGQTVVNFASSSGTLPVPESGSTFEIPVNVTTVSNSDRTIDLSIDESSTADASEYTIESAIVPAGEYNGSVVVVGNFDNLPDFGTTNLVLNLDGIEGGDRVDTRDSFTLGLFKQCPSDLAGAYEVRSTGASTDPGIANQTVENFPYSVTISQVEGSELDYTITDGFAGVYIEWYAAAYGYNFETEGSFTDVCGNLSGAWVDGFESNVVLEGTVNEDGTLTIMWENDYGDAVTATYTPVDGPDDSTEDEDDDSEDDESEDDE